MTTRRDLTLHEKVQLIFDNNDGNGLSQRKLAEKYKISLGSVSNILKRKEEYLNGYETNQNQNVKRKFKNEHGQQLDDQVYEWFAHQRSKGIPISGPILQQKAVEISEPFGQSFGSFKGSNGWLEKFRQRHNISYNSICGESSSVNVVSVQDWIERIPKTITGYDKENIFNCGETSLFFKAMPNKSLTVKREECKGGKKSKERVTVLFCVSSVGEKLKPLVIGKSKKPRCFKSLNVNNLPIEWHGNRTAWMNAKIFTEWLLNLNELMKRKKRKIILFMDNAPCHPVDIILSNVRLQYFPPNTTPVLQPLDQGIIRAFKAHYRKYLVKHIIACCATAQTPDDIKISYLDAIHWIDLGWQAVTDATICNTFGKAGFKFGSPNDTMSSNSDHPMTSPTSDYSTASSPSTSSDNSAISSVHDEQSEALKILDDLLQHIAIGGQRMNANDFVDLDEDMPAFNLWLDDDELVDDTDFSSTEIPPKISEVMEIMRKLHLFAIAQHPQLHPIIDQLESKITMIFISVQNRKSKQY